MTATITRLPVRESTIERAMKRAERNNQMSVFDFVYPLCVGTVQIAEIEGRCTVEPDRRGFDSLVHLEIEFYQCGGHQTVPATGILRAQVDEWLWRTHQDTIWAGAPRERDPAPYPVSIGGKV